MRKQPKSESGRSVLEIVTVLIIMVILTVSSMYMFNVLVKKNKTQETVKEIATVVSQLQTSSILTKYGQNDRVRMTEVVAGPRTSPDGETMMLAEGGESSISVTALGGKAFAAQIQVSEESCDEVMTLLENSGAVVSGGCTTGIDVAFNTEGNFFEPKTVKDENGELKTEYTFRECKTEGYKKDIEGNCCAPADIRCGLCSGCEEGLCESKEDCCKDDECLNRTTCERGRCQQLECLDNDDCEAEGKQCQNNKCVKTCETDAECPKGTYCVRGVCETVNCPNGTTFNTTTRTCGCASGVFNGTECVTCYQDPSRTVDPGCTVGQPNCEVSEGSSKCVGCTTETADTDCPSARPELGDGEYYCEAGTCEKCSAETPFRDENTCRKCRKSDNAGCSISRPICWDGSAAFGDTCYVCANDKEGAAIDKGCSDIAPRCDGLENQGGNKCECIAHKDCPDGRPRCNGTTKVCEACPRGQVWDKVNEVCHYSCPAGTTYSTSDQKCHCPNGAGLRIGQGSYGTPFAPTATSKNTCKTCATGWNGSECYACVNNKTGGSIDTGCTSSTPICPAAQGKGSLDACRVCFNDNPNIFTVDAGCSSSTPRCDATDGTYGARCFKCKNNQSGNNIDNGCSAETPRCDAADGTIGNRCLAGTCGANQIWHGGSCKCNANYYWNGSSCVRCPGNGTKGIGNATSCTCTENYDCGYKGHANHYESDCNEHCPNGKKCWVDEDRHKAYSEDCAEDGFTDEDEDYPHDVWFCDPQPKTCSRTYQCK